MIKLNRRGRKVQGELFGQNLHKTTAKIRCPGCLKPYAIHRNQVHTDKPRFECKACGQQFWVASPECFAVEDVIGFPIQNSAANLQHKADSRVVDPTLEAKIFNCPKCAEPYSAGQTECSKCGLVFRKFEKLQGEEGSLRADPALQKAWENLIINYRNLKQHIRFVESCQKAGELPFAAEKYQRLIESAPDNEIASDMLNEIAQRAEKALAPKNTKPNVKTKLPLPANLGFLFILGIGLSLTTLGIFSLPLRNLTGVGVATIFLAGCVRYYFLDR